MNGLKPLLACDNIRIMSYRRLAVLMLVFVIASCSPASLLSGVTVAPQTISPNADGVEDVARIQYMVGRPVQVSIYFVDAQGEKHFFRNGNRRVPGEYEALFGGNIDGLVLPDGNYSYVVEAVDMATGERESVSGELVISGADTQPPQLLDFSVFPPTFTPNQDGINDRVAVSFRIEEKAWVEVYLLNGAGRKYPLGRPRSFGMLEEELLLLEDPQRMDLGPGLVEFDYDGGIDLGIAPPPDGTYTVVAIAQDQAGNTTRLEASLEIKDGGLPLAIVKFVEFSPRVVPLGQALTFTAIVENVGAVPIRTNGPEPGTVYHSTENFNTLGFFESDGVFRLGVDFEGNSLGRRYPYRWQLGFSRELEARVIDGKTWYYLLPGQRVQVSGSIIIDEAPPREAPFFWMGLIHEGVRIVNDFQNPTRISVGF